MTSAVEVAVETVGEVALRAWEREGEEVCIGVVNFRVNFRGGEGVFRETRLWVLFGDWEGDCFLFVKTSEKSLEGAGGEPQIRVG